MKPTLYRYVACLLFALLLAALAWYQVARPRDVAAAWYGPLNSASFAPFHDGQSPLKEIFPTAEQIEADVVRLKGLFSGLRTYTTRNGMEQVPVLAEQHGFTLTHGAWLGREEDEKGRASNRAEIETLIETANRHPDGVKRVLVGNEVLLRRDLSPEQLIAYIDQVRQAIEQPVSYADVWAFWLKHPQLADHVDYITIHILPYWEDEPVSVEVAQQHMLDIINRIKARFPGKPILVGETGWPTEGRSRGPAHADRLTAAAFVRDLPRLAQQHGFDYNVVEAYDQHWKGQLEGTVGARWGLFDEARTLKFALHGPVEPLDNTMPRALASLVLGMLVAMLLLPQRLPAAKGILVALWSQLLAAAVVQAVYMSLRLAVAPASFTWAQQRLLFFVADQGWLPPEGIAFWYRLLLQRWAETQAHGWAWVLAVFSMAFALMLVLWLRGLLRGNAPALSARLAGWAFGAYGVGFVVFSAMFATVGRYIDIPLHHVMLALVATSGLWLALWCQPRRPTADFAIITPSAFINRHACWLLPLSAVACIAGEVNAMLNGEDFITMHPLLEQQVPLIAGSILANHQLLWWCAGCTVLGLVFSRQPVDRIPT